MMKKNYIILKNIFDIFVFVNSYLFTIKTVTKSCFTIKLDNYCFPNKSCRKAGRNYCKFQAETRIKISK